MFNDIIDWYYCNAAYTDVATKSAKLMLISYLITTMIYPIVLRKSAPNRFVFSKHISLWTASDLISELLVKKTVERIVPGTNQHCIVCLRRSLFSCSNGTSFESSNYYICYAYVRRITVHPWEFLTWQKSDLFKIFPKK